MFNETWQIQPKRNFLGESRMTQWPKTTITVTVNTNTVDPPPSPNQTTVVHHCQPPRSIRKQAIRLSQEKRELVNIQNESKVRKIASDPESCVPFIPTSNFEPSFPPTSDGKTLYYWKQTPATEHSPGKPTRTTLKGTKQKKRHCWNSEFSQSRPLDLALPMFGGSGE